MLEVLNRDVLEAAPVLLGAKLVKGEMVAQIVEVEAYRSDDPACHAFQRRTPRTEIMYGPAGIAYVYFNYGVHWMLNIVCHPGEDAAAILIRAARPIAGLEEMRLNRPGAIDRNLLSGPGKLAQAFGITGQDNGTDLMALESDGLRIIPAAVPVTNVLTGPRIGIAVGKWHEVPWRFVDGDAREWISRAMQP